MNEITWIKIAVGMFDNEKIDYIESLPDADAILIIWIKLLTLTGKSNSGGYIMLAEKIPYNAEMLAHKFRRPLNTVKMALAIFQHLKMVEVDEFNRISILNWEKYQNIEGMDKVKEQTRNRVKAFRERQKALICNDDVTQSNVTVTEQNKSESKRENITPLPPNELGEFGKKPSRYYGTNPRAKGLNPRAEEEKQAEIDRMVRLLTDPASHHCDKTAAIAFINGIPRQKLSESVLKMLVEIQYLYNFSPQTCWVIEEFERLRSEGNQEISKLWKQVGEVIEQAKEAIRCKIGSETK